MNIRNQVDSQYNAFLVVVSGATMIVMTIALLYLMPPEFASVTLSTSLGVGIIAVAVGCWKLFTTTRSLHKGCICVEVKIGNNVAWFVRYLKQIDEQGTLETHHEMLRRPILFVPRQRPEYPYQISPSFPFRTGRVLATLKRASDDPAQVFKLCGHLPVNDERLRHLVRELVQRYGCDTNDIRREIERYFGGAYFVPELEITA